MKVLALLLLAGCTPPVYPQADQCLRAELFERCMKMLPAGPVQTHYNDWAEIVSECGEQAYNQSARMPDVIKAECRSRSP